MQLPFAYLELLMQLPIPIPCQQRLDSVVGIQEVADGYVVVQGIDE